MDYIKSNCLKHMPIEISNSKINKNILKSLGDALKIEKPTLIMERPSYAKNQFLLVARTEMLTNTRTVSQEHLQNERKKCRGYTTTVMTNTCTKNLRGNVRRTAQSWRCILSEQQPSLWGFTLKIITEENPCSF